MTWGPFHIQTRDTRLSRRRILALAVTIGCHLAGLMFLLQAPSALPATTVLAEPDPSALKIRLITRSPASRPTSPSAAPSPTPSTASASRSTTLPLLPKGLKPSRAPGAMATTHPLTASPVAEHPGPVSIPVPAATSATATAASPSGPDDGGFQQRLREAQHDAGARPLPGSDTRRAPGFQLIDPMKQGIGSVMRDTQRLFGVTNHHCVDVEVWEHLTPEQRIERHVSLADMRRMNEKYECNRPLGLSL